MKNIIITGVPEMRDENLSNVFNAIQRAVHSNIPAIDIFSIHRLPRKRATAINGASAPSSAVQPIIVSFKNTEVKKSFMMQKKSKVNQLTTSNIGFDGTPKKIFINDQLTDIDGVLFSKAKALKDAGLFKYVWTSMGKVLMRRGENQPIIRIRSEDDLARMQMDRSSAGQQSGAGQMIPPIPTSAAGHYIKQ